MAKTKEKENERKMKTKENELLTSKVSELESRCVSLSEENGIGPYTPSLS